MISEIYNTALDASSRGRHLESVFYSRSLKLKNAVSWRGGCPFLRWPHKCFMDNVFKKNTHSAILKHIRRRHVVPNANAFCGVKPEQSRVKPYRNS
jgi:hypothetical protein